MIVSFKFSGNNMFNCSLGMKGSDTAGFYTEAIPKVWSSTKNRRTNFLPGSLFPCGALSGSTMSPASLVFSFFTIYIGCFFFLCHFEQISIYIFYIFFKGLSVFQIKLDFSNMDKFCIFALIMLLNSFSHLISNCRNYNF